MDLNLIFTIVFSYFFAVLNFIVAVGILRFLLRKGEIIFTMGYRVGISLVAFGLMFQSIISFYTAIGYPRPDFLWMTWTLKDLGIAIIFITHVSNQRAIRNMLKNNASWTMHGPHGTVELIPRKDLGITLGLGNNKPKKKPFWATYLRWKK